MNSLVAEYRNRRPDDTRSDEELTLLLGRAHDVDGRYAGYPDFVEEYQSTKARLAKEEVPFKSEFRRGLKRGVSGLKQSAVGAGALAADVVGAESLRDTALEKYRDLQAEDASVNAPGVARIEDVGSVSDLARYVMGKGGELVPQIAEAAIAGVAGAAAGSAAAPGPGTVAGGVGGFLSRRAAKKILSEGIEAVLEKRGLAAIEKEIVKDQLKNVAERNVISDAIRPEVVDLLNLETKSMLSKGGALGAELSNFYGIGAGTIYGETANREGVDKADARRAALVGGIGSAIANAPLPLMVISRFFPGASQEVVRSYMQRLAADAAKEIPLGAGGEVLDELFQIAAEKYADPKLRDKPLSDEDLSRLLNAGVVGGFAGALMSPASAIPSQGFHPVVEQHFRNVPEDRRRQIAALVVRSESGNQTEQDIISLRNLTVEERNFAAVFGSMPQSERDKYAAATQDLGGDSNGQEDERQGQEGLLASPGGKPAPAAEAVAETTTAGAAATAPASIYLTREEALKQGPDAVTDIMNKHGIDRDAAVAVLAKWRKEYGISKEVASTISDATHKALEDLGYNEQERNNLRPEEAQSIIDAQLESPRQRLRRASVATPMSDPAVAAARAKVSEAAAKTNTNPTEKQKETGQYKKGTVNIDGFNIAIENPIGSERSGKDASGKPWSVQMPAHYGYFTDSVGSDGDKLDVYVGPNPTSQKVFVIDQTRQDGSFDETKTMFGFDSKEQAIAAYDSAFSDGRGPRLRGEVTEITKERLREWVNSKQTKKPFAYQTTPIKQIATIGSLNSQQFASMAAEHKSMQVHAYKFGASLKDQSELTALEIGKKAAEKELNEAKKRVEDAIKSGNKDAVTADVNSIGPLIAKTQWFSEAIEAATGVEKASIAEVLGKDYIAPFGKKKEEPKPSKKPALTKEEQAELEGVEVNAKETVRKEKPDLKQSVLRWLLGGPKPKEPTTLYRGVEIGRDDPSPDSVKFLHATPWIGVAKKAGKFGGEVAVKEFKARVGQLYYRGGSLEGDPLESTKLNSIRGMSWDDALSETKKIFDAYLVKKLSDEDSYIKSIKDSNPQKAERYIENLRSAAAKDAISDLVNGTFETDVLNRPGKWHGDKPIPDSINKETPDLRTNDEVAEWDAKNTQPANVSGRIGEESRAITLDDVGFSEKIYQGEGKQRGWFRTGGEVTNREIETKLVSEYSPDSDAAKTNTHRISAVLDRKTGRVHLLSTYSTHGKIMMTKPEGGKRPGVAVATMLAAKLKDGSNRYQVIGSAYTKETTNFLNQQFQSLEQFEAQFGKPADEAMDHAVGQAGAVSAIIPEGAKEAKTKIKQAVNEIGLGKPAKVKLSAADIELLKTIPRFDSPEEFTDMFVDGELSTEQVELAHRISEQDINFFERMRRMGLKDTLKEYGYEIGNEANQRPRRKGKPAPVSEQADVVPPVGELGESPDGGPEADLEGEQDSVGEQGQEGDGGDEEPIAPDDINEQADKQTLDERMFDASVYDTEEYVMRQRSASVPLPKFESAPATDLLDAIYSQLDERGRQYVELAKSIIQRHGINPKLTTHEVLTDKATGRRVRGLYNNRGSEIHIGSASSYRQAARTVAHEIIHHVLARKLNDISSGNVVNDADLANYKKLKNLLAIAKERAGDQKFYGLTNVHEFTAEAITNPKFQNFLRTIKSESGNVWSRLVDLISRVLGIDSGGTILNDILSTTDQLIDSPVERIFGTLMYAEQRSSTEMVNERFSTSFEGEKKLLERLDGERRMFARIENEKRSIGVRAEKMFGLSERYSGDDVFYPDADDTDSEGTHFNLDKALNRRDVASNGVLRKTEIEKVVAPINHLIGLQDKIAKAIESNEALNKVVDAKEMPTMDWVRSIMKVADPKQTKELLKGWQEAGGGAIEYDANKTIDQFADKSNSDAVLKRAYQNTEAMLAKMSRVKADAELSLEQMGEKLKRQKDAIKKETEEYKNLAGQSTKFRRDIVQSFRDVFSSISGLSRRKGIIEQQLAQLDAKLKIEDYAKAFESIVSNRVKNDVLFNTLEAMANDPEIDISKPIKKIRESMLSQPTKYALFLNDNSESRALLATAVAFAKTHAATMAELELRREKSGEKRAEIEQQINNVNAEKSELIKDISSLAKTAKLEERARKARYDKLKRIRATEKSISLAKQRIAVVDAAAPVISSELARLGAKMDIAADFTFADGATYLAVKPGMSSADAPKNAKRLVLDKSKRTITNPKQMESELLDMKSWLMAREEAYNNGDLSAKDSVYQFVNRQFHEIAGHLHYNLDAAPAERWLWEFAAMSEFKTIKEAFNTAAAQAFERMGNLYEVVRSALVREGTKVAHRVTQLEDELIKIAPMSRDVLRSQVLNPTKNLLQYHTEDLAEIYAGDRERLATAAYARVRKMLLDADYTKNLIGPKINEFMPVLRQLIEVQHDYNKRQIDAIENGVMVRNPITGRDERASVGVLDPKLKVLDPTTGEMVSGIRRHMAVGPWTFSQKLSQEFNVMTNALRLSGWDKFQHIIGQYKEATENTPEFLGNVGEAYKEGGHDEASDLVSKFFSHPEHGDHVRNSFLRAVAEMPRSLFDAPIMDDGVTSVPANPDIVRQAINDVPAGDVIGFAERMFELHEGSGDKARYVQHVVQRLADIYKNVDGIERKTNPDPGSTRVRSIKGMTPGAMINAREIEDLPGSWFNYHDFDQRDVFRSSQNIASEIAFGRGQERGQAMVDTIANEIDDAIAKLQSERIRVQRLNPGMTEQDLEKVVEKNLGQQYKQLKRFEERQHLLNKSVGRLSDYFRKDNSPDGTVRVATRAGSFLGALMVNNPGSALYQMSQLFDTMFRYGVSPSSIFATGRVVAKSVHELAASMMQAVGVEIGNNAEYQELRNELGLTDPAAAAKLKDSFSRWHGETTPAFAIRAAGDVIQAGINPVGERAQHVVFRPGGVFSMSTNIADWGLTYGMWKMTERFVAKGIEHLRSNPSKLDGVEPLTWRDLGLKEWNGDRESFERLKLDMSKWGIDFDQMVRSAIKRGDGTAFTNEEALRLHSMAMSEISSQANLSTMTASAWNNSIMRFMIPLLGWSIRRTLDVSGKRLDQDGVTSMKALGRGLAALSVISVGGLAISALVDRYYEDLLNKKRNLRPILSPAGFIEHTARLGQTGLLGELANGVINMGSGGDSRIISLDRRVVALSAFQTLQNTIAVMINQGEADYARVVRPLAASLGAGGMLQYMQLVNNVMGLDNAESRITARMNAQNYLRAGGREIGMDVKTFAGGGGAAHVTPMSPYISRMEMAAYGNNGVDFQIAYREAVARAKELGHDDPVDYVKRAFAARNPLRLVFQTPPSETEYRRLLNSLPEDGRNDVTEAVDHFNTFSQLIGARPFEGKRESVQKLAAPRFTTADFRQAALSFR